MTDTNTLPKNCYTNPEYPNDAICTNPSPIDIKCDTISKEKNDIVIGMYYTKKNNNWSCNTKAGNCYIDPCKNIIYYDGNPCVILSNTSSNNFIDSPTIESAICINTNNKIVKYNYYNSQWTVKNEPIIMKPKPQSKLDIVDTNPFNYIDDAQSTNMD